MPAANPLKGFDLDESPEAPPVVRFTPGPYVLTVKDPVSPEVAAELVKPFLATIGRKSAKLLMRQQDAWAAKMLEYMDTCPAWMFKALHAAIKQLAGELPGAPRALNPGPLPPPHAY